MQRADGRRSRAAFALALALACAAFGLARAARGADDPSAALDAAEALRAKGDAAGALKLLRPLAEDPALESDPRVQSAFGKALLVGGDPADAVAAFRAVVRTRPDPAARLDLASALLAKAKNQIAAGARLSLHVVPDIEDAMANASAVAPTDPVLRRRVACVVGEAQLLLGNPTAARAALADATLTRDPAAEDLLARACYALGDFAAAADAWGRAGNADGQAAAWSAGKDPRAIPWYASRAIEHWSESAIGGMAIRGAAYVDGGDGLEAAFVAAIAGPDVAADKRSAIERLRGRLAERRGRFRDAVERYRSVAAARPSEWESDRDLARALFFLSATEPTARDEAIGLYRKVLAVRGTDVDSRVALAYQAVTDATGAHREWPDHRLLDRAVEIFRALAESAPDDQLAWSQYGNAARIAGASDASVAAYDRAVALNEFDASTWNDRGLALLAAGRRADAIQSFERAIAADPGDTSSRQNAARQLRLAGKDDEADAHLAAALRTARAISGQASLYRSLTDRGMRARRRPELR